MNIFTESKMDARKIHYPADRVTQYGKDTFCGEEQGSSGAYGDPDTSYQTGETKAKVTCKHCIDLLEHAKKLIEGKY